MPQFYPVVCGRCGYEEQRTLDELKTLAGWTDVGQLCPACLKAIKDRHTRPWQPPASHPLVALDRSLHQLAREQGDDHADQ